MRMNPQLKFIRRIFCPEQRLQILLTHLQTELFKVGLKYQCCKIKNILKQFPMVFNNFSKKLGNDFNENNKIKIYNLFQKDAYSAKM